MGVHGLWKLIEPAGKPVPVETLDDKVLAVDVSIWLHQLMKGYQNPGGSSVSNAYLLGLFSRVCKLLFTNIKPVFVFDGGVPQLKRKTIAARQQQRNKAEQASEKVREQLLKNLLKQKAVSQVLEEIRGQTSPKKKAPDMFELPPLPEVEDSPSEVEEMSTSSSEEDVKPLKMKYKDLHTINVNSADFKALPADMRHDILTELKETRKQNSWGRIHEMPEESGDFSKYQMSRLLKRRSVQVSLEEAEKEMGGRTLSLVDVEALLAEGGIEINPQLGKRIASDDVTRYIYVRETGEQSKSQSPSTIASISTNVNQKDSSSPIRSEANLVKIKEEIISSDEFSDLELINEVESIEAIHNITIKEENIEEFGTENMFEEESSSEGLIIDDLDLVKDSSGLSQEQILAIIKQQNLAGLKLNENKPSTSKTETFPEDNSEINSTNVEEGVAINTSLSLTKLPACPESKILDSVYFKTSKRIQTVIQKHNQNKLSQKPKSTDKSLNSTIPSENEQMLIKNVDLSALAVDFYDSEDDKTLNLPCVISEIKLPNTSIRTITNIAHKINSDNLNKLSDTKIANPEQIAALSSSSDSADDDFLEVTPSNEISLGPNENVKIIQGLQIEIQSNQDTIEDDIFADVFSNGGDVPVNTTSNSSSKMINRVQNNKLCKAEGNSDNQHENTKPSASSVQNITKKDDILGDILPSNLNNSKVIGKQSSKFSLPTKPILFSHQTECTQSGFQRENSSIIEDLKKKKKTNHPKKVEHIKRILDEDPAGIFDPKIDSEDSEDLDDLPSEPNSPKHIVSCNEPESELSSDEMSVKPEKLVPTDGNMEKPEELPPINHNADNPSKYTSIDEKNQVCSNVESNLDSTSCVLDTQNKAEIEATSEMLSNTHGSQDKPKRTLDSKQLETLQDILENKERELVVDQNREDRAATSLTNQMYQEAQELLRLFGVPYVVAPMEAEAQCAFMDAAGLTQGTITDDSDIWLFGGRKVYKNFFDQKKFVLEFQADNIHHYFKLSRNHLVLMALLVGSDYTVGLQGVGAVTALEILATFPPAARQDTPDAQELLTSMIQFKQWWQSRSLTHAPLAKKLKNIDLHQGFPSPAVVSAYLDPQVDDSREAFSWGEPDLPGLRDYAERKFGWSRNRTDQILLPVVNRLSQKTRQLTLHTFFGSIPNITAHREQMSRRVHSAVHRLEGGSDELEQIQQRQRQPRRRGRGRTAGNESGPARGGGRGTGRGRGRVAAEDEEQLFIHDSVGKAPEVIPQREKDKQEALKRKQQAVEILKNKKRKGLKKRRNVRQEKPEANLSESSSSSDDN